MTHEKYYVSIADSLSISRKEKKYSIATNFLNDSVFKQLINALLSPKQHSISYNALSKTITSLLSRKQHSIQLVVNSRNNENLGSINYRFGYDIASSGHKYRNIKKIICDLTILRQDILLKFNIIASPVIYEGHKTSSKDELKEFNKQYIFRLPFTIVPNFFDLNYKQSSFFVKNNDDNYIKLYNMERLKNKYGRVLYIFNDNEDEHFLIDIAFLSIGRIADGYKKISEFSYNKEEAPEYPKRTGYIVRSHLLSFSHMKNILLHSFSTEKKFTQLPIKTIYEGENLGKLFYSYGTDINEENKAERLIERISYTINTTNIELSIKIEVIASGIDKNKLSSYDKDKLNRELTYIEKEKHIEKFHIRIPHNYVSEIFDFNQSDKDIFEKYNKI